MPPRKKVLVLAELEWQLSEWRLVLDTHRWQVLCAATLREAWRLLGENQDCTVALVLTPRQDWVTSLCRARCCDGGVKVVLAGVPAEKASGTTADAVFLEQPGLRALVLDRLKTMTLRKRGPTAEAKPVEHALAAEVWPAMGPAVLLAQEGRAA